MNVRQLLAIAVLVVLPGLAPAPAAARNVTSEVQYFKSVQVLYSENASKCGFKDKEILAKAVASGLSALDIPYNPDALTKVNLKITADAYGVLDQRCMAYMELQLEQDLGTSFVDATAIQGKEQVFSIFSQRDYVFPVIFFETGALFADLAPNMQDRAGETLKLLLQNLKDARRLK